jgi:site-specific recombinase XerD
VNFQEKKMSSVQKFFNVQFVPPKLKHNSLGWHIEYYVYDPIIERLDRKRYRLNALRKKCSSAREFQVQAAVVLQRLAQKLSAGWVPSDDVASYRYSADLFETLDLFIEIKEKELRKDSIRSYKGVIKLLKEWLKQSFSCIEFQKEHALDFMDYLYLTRKVGSNTYNNYLKICRVIFSWLESNLYVKENAFVGIQRKRAQEKYREVIPSHDRARIAEWCKEKSPGFLLVCNLVYYSLIRPSEILRLQFKHINFEHHYIYLPAVITKCRVDRYSAMDAETERALLALSKDASPDDYLFGSKFRPGAKPTLKKRYAETWSKLRADLGLPATYQLYSLRDSGITDKMESGIEPRAVMHAAGHHDLSITTKYLKKADQSLIDLLIEKSPTF